MMSRKGYDISVWQDGLDINKITKDNFAIIRAGYSTSKDKCFDKFYKQLKANRVPVGAYWYSYAKTVDEAKAEARKCIEVLKGKQFELPIYFDVEEQETLNKGKTAVSNIVKAFCNELEKAKYFVGIYMSRCAILSYLTDEVQKRYALWVADWTGSCKYTKNPVGMWQSGIGKLDNRDIDLDVMYIDYPSIIKGGGFNGFSNKIDKMVSYKLYVNGILNYSVKVKKNDKVELRSE